MGDLEARFPDLMSMDPVMEIVDSPSRMRVLSQELRRSNFLLGLVPTMGALHEGHLSLIRRAVAACPAVVVSIFLNPIQFGPNEDLCSYPRTMERDLEVCRKESVSVVYAPPQEKMYAKDFDTWVEVPSLASGLCGSSRPGHFRGVATVVTKLLAACRPDKAFFGEKDYQQLVLIRRMVRDLDLGVEIVGCPTVREADGIAMSSRNVHLNGDERARAQSLSRGLFQARELLRQGERSSSTLRKMVCEELTRAKAEIDYVEVVAPDTLVPVERVDSPCRILVAAKIGKTRLIDNILLEP